MRRYDVVIVGFGPVGAIAACLFGQAGLKTLVIDSVAEIYDKPRAVALDHEIARVLQGLGLGEALAACAEPFTDSVFFGAQGQVIKRLTMLPPPHPQGWTPSMVFMQPQLEQAVRDHVRRYDSVTVALGCTLTGLTQGPEGVTLTINGPEREETIEGRALIGCDGASSTTRKLAGLGLTDLGFDEPWLVVDVLANEAGLARLPKTSVQYCEPARPTTHVICTGNHRRWEFSLNPGEDPRAMAQPEAVWRLLSRWITPDDATLWRSAAYRFHALVATEWRQGRVFLAGDAAHQQPPFLGQGLCQGIRDVANLGWKLIRVLHGQASPSLLDSYGHERGGHVRGLTGTIKKIGQLIGQRDPAAAAERDAQLIAEAGGDVQPQPRQDLMPALAAGFLGPEGQPGRGMLFPQPWLITTAGHVRMDDAAGPGFRLVTTAMPGPSLDAAMGGLGGRVIALGPGRWQEADGVAAAWLGARNVRFALVRPDHYVFGTAADDTGALALIKAATAALSAA